MRDNNGRVFTQVPGVYVHLYRQHSSHPVNGKLARLVIEDERGLTYGVAMDREGLMSLVDCISKAVRAIEVVEMQEHQAMREGYK
jgi:hypothetical protein